MSRTSYMPDKQGAQVAWSLNFSTVINSAPTVFGLTEQQAQGFASVNTSLQASYLNGTNPSTKTKVTVAAKDTALRNMKIAARDLVSIIQGQPFVSPAQKEQLGITNRKTTTSTIPAPTQKPFIKIVKIDGRTVTVELRQNTSKRGKPAKVAGATVFTATGTAAPEGNEAWSFATNTTKTTFDIPFGPSSTGDTVWITAFWNNAKDQSGPAASAVSVNLPAGGVMPSEVKESVRLAA